MQKKIKKFLNKIKFKPYIIAEIGINHEGSITKAKKMINGIYIILLNYLKKIK